MELAVMWTKQFWADALERAVKSAANAVLLLVGADQLNVFTLDWQQTSGLALGAAFLSVLMSIGSARFGTKGTASLVAEVGYTPQHAAAHDQNLRAGQ